MTRLRKKMLDDLQLRNYSRSTCGNYVRAVAQFARFFNRSPAELGPEHVRKYLLHLVRERRVACSTYVGQLCALRFFYEVTLKRPGTVQSIPSPKLESHLSVVLSFTEVQRLFAAISNLKHRAILSTIYAAGLRVSEVESVRHAKRLISSACRVPPCEMVHWNPRNANYEQ